MTPLRILSFSDCHLGNIRLDSQEMCLYLGRLVFPLMAECDFVIIGGDLFDSAIGLSDKQATDILEFLIEFLQLADKYHLVVRVLRGTYSHDRTQPEIIPVLHKTYGFTNDLKYVDTVSLEHIERFDMRVVYVPDDVPYPSSNAVMEVIAEQMTALGWDTVDYGFLHGYFQHVLPEHAAARPKLLYTKEQFGFITRYVLAGHVHDAQASDFVIYNRSTDRMNHGEEGPKGLITIDDQVTHAKVRFVENINATVFRTLDYAHVEQEEDIIHLLNDVIATYPTDRIIHIRVLHPKSDIRIGLQRYVAKHHKHIRFTHKTNNKEQHTLSEELDALLDVELLSPPTPETLPTLIMDHLTAQGISTTLTTERVQHLLNTAGSS